MKEEFKQWSARIVGGSVMGETGDYDDGYWEISNGKQAFYTNDDDESAISEDEKHQWRALLRALNKCKATFWTRGDDRAVAYHIQLAYVKEQNTLLREYIALLHQVIQSSPCDPDITTEQIDAVKAMNEFRNQHEIQ